MGSSPQGPSTVGALGTAFDVTATWTIWFRMLAKYIAKGPEFLTSWATSSNLHICMFNAEEIGRTTRAITARLGSCRTAALCQSPAFLNAPLSQWLIDGESCDKLKGGEAAKPGKHLMKMHDRQVESIGWSVVVKSGFEEYVKSSAALFAKEGTMCWKWFRKELISLIELVIYISNVVLDNILVYLLLFTLKPIVGFDSRGCSGGK